MDNLDIQSAVKTTAHIWVCKVIIQRDVKLPVECGQTVQGCLLPCLGECDEFPGSVPLRALQFVHLVSAVGTLEGEHLTVGLLGSGHRARNTECWAAEVTGVFNDLPLNRI